MYNMSRTSRALQNFPELYGIIKIKSGWQPTAGRSVKKMTAREFLDYAGEDFTKKDCFKNTGRPAGSLIPAK